MLNQKANAIVQVTAMPLSPFTARNRAFLASTLLYPKLWGFDGVSHSFPVSFVLSLVNPQNGERMMTPTEPLLLVAIARSKRRHKLHQELESLAADYIAGENVKEQMQIVLDGLGSLHEINASNLDEHLNLYKKRDNQ
jgi:hypothetical protein